VTAYKALVQRVAAERDTPDLVDIAEAIELGVHPQAFEDDVREAHTGVS